jgi:NAD(P)-dependent dehydrogenase (short-subunit alcohol dehydrogenase family)
LPPGHVFDISFLFLLFTICLIHFALGLLAEKTREIAMICTIITTGMFGTANYAASKAGLFGLAKTVTKEVARFAITVNCLAF